MADVSIFQKSIQPTGGLFGAIEQGSASKRRREGRQEKSAAAEADLTAQKIANFSESEKARTESLVKGALFLQNVPDDKKLEALDRRIGALGDAEVDSSDTQEIRDLIADGRFEEANQIIDQTASLAFAFGIGQPKRGFQKTASFLVRNEDGTTEIATGVFDPNTGGLTTETASFDADQLVSKLGETAEEQTQRRVGEAEAKAGALAEVELETKPTIEATTAAAKQAIALSGEAFGRLEKIKTNITNIDEGLRLLGEGAGTGPVISLLPSIRQASVELDNVQKRMGLDVIGNTTFGALSKGELDLALSTALPQKLGPEALKTWLKNKKEAQVKLSDYISEVATFLGTPGNTVKDFLEIQGAKPQEAIDTKPPKAVTTKQITDQFSFEEIQEVATHFGESHAKAIERLKRKKDEGS